MDRLRTDMPNPEKDEQHTHFTNFLRIITPFLKIVREQLRTTDITNRKTRHSRHLGRCKGYSQRRKKMRYCYPSHMVPAGSSFEEESSMEDTRINGL